MKTTRLLLCLLALAPIRTALAQGSLEMGKMWTFENPPLAYLKEEYGFEPSPEWLDALRLASLRFGGGCSASFVSPKGLIMTNHHCVRGEIAAATPSGQDWVKTGFCAGAVEDEVRLPGLTVQQLVAMEDVTAAMAAGIEDGDDDATAQRRRDQNRARILAEASERHPGRTPQVVKLHQGAVYQLYVYRIWDDVRLVCAPHLQTSHFGGDPDNFTYPRYAIDFTFCRAYENGEPADTEAHYFRWSTTGAKEDELVFVTGNPGTTDRLKTAAEMEVLRDVSYPIVRQMIDSRLAIMRDIAAQGSEQEQAMRTEILMYENAQKAYMGYHEALLDPELMAQKARAEAEFEGKVAANEELRARFGDAWSELEELSALRAASETRRRFHIPAGSKHLARALELVRAVQSTGEARDQHAAKALDMGVAMSEFERRSFADHLRRAAQWLPPYDPYRREIVGDRPPEETAALLEKSAIGDPDFGRGILEGGPSALRASTDPAVRMALVLEPLLRAKDKLDQWLGEQTEAQGVRIGQALFACYGNKVSPDATFTLRFSDGRAKGFPCNGTIAPYRTSFYGLYARHAEFDGHHPFDLPEVWLERQDRIDMTKSVDFVSTNDIIGGNSGSPIVNANLEVVGLIFDGNIEMLANKFLYTDGVPRAVSVHCEAIMEALRKVYDAERVADELVGHR